MLRRDGVTGWTTIGVGVQNDDPCLYLYWASRKAMKANGGLPAVASGFPVLHKFMGKLTIGTNA
jgi:hypothetical protein